MTNFIPIFPLSIVVYPGEELNLHIFEPKYKQLVKECIEQKKEFGIPTVINSAIAEYGTTVEIVELKQEHEDGSMDIRTRGVNVFRVLEVIRELPEKLYSGAIVNYPHNTLHGTRLLMKKVIASMLELHEKLNVQKDFHKSHDELWSYDLAHHAGLTLEEEYEILGLMKELQRQEYLKRHLAKVLPVVTEMEELKRKVKLNGHFKNLEGFNL